MAMSSENAEFCAVESASTVIKEAMQRKRMEFLSGATEVYIYCKGAGMPTTMEDPIVNSELATTSGRPSAPHAMAGVVGCRQH